MSKKAAEWLLAGVIFARSTSLLFAKVGLESMSPLNLLAVRFCLAFAVLCVIFWKKLRHVTKTDLLHGMILGGAFFAVMTCEVFGLTMTTASTVSFLTNTAIVIVPLFEAVLHRTAPDRRALLCAAVTLAGVGFLTLKNGLSGFGLGEGLCLMEACLYAIAIILTAKFSHEGDAILLSSAAVNYALYEKFSEKAIIVDEVNPEQLKKAIKNPVEIENMRKAHIKDGLAVTRFMRWVKDTIGKEKMTELSAAEKINSLRFATPGNLGLSFGTISAYGEHAALPHYAPTKESDLTVEPHGFLLVDSGGQYYEGTTDITRTIAVGPLTEDEKKHFALVLRSMLRLANAKFLYGCRGLNIDILARGPLWDEGLDYKHGTGHGVGYLLNVHEGPNGFRWKVVPERVDSCVYEEGMITSDEPGIYIEGSHGIRTENLIVCRKGEKNEYGQFMYFETLTCAPIDLDAIDPDLLNADERRMLNDYHRFVYDTLSPLMDAEEREWLAKYTRAI